MTPLISRAEAGLVPPTRTQRSTATLLTAHYGGDSPWGATADRSSAERFAATTDHRRCATIWRAWQSFHMSGRGWTDIGYNSGICLHGYRYEGRGPGVRSGAQLGSVNALTDAICYIAGAGDPLTDPAKHALLDEAERFGRAITRDHSTWQSTACAGPAIRAWIAAGTPRPQGDDDMAIQTVIGQDRQRRWWSFKNTSAFGVELTQDEADFWYMVDKSMYTGDPDLIERLKRANGLVPLSGGIVRAGSG